MGGRVWTRRVVFGVVDPGRRQGPRPGPVCGRMVLRSCSGRALAVAIFMRLGIFPLLAGDAWCSRIAEAAWCCSWCRSAARLDARSCRALCGVPAPDGRRLPVVLLALVVCSRSGEWTVARGVEVDGLEDVEVVGTRGGPVADGARAPTFVALVAAVVRDGGWVVMVPVLRVGVEELWCRATAALPYVPGCGTGTSGWSARRATGKSLRGRGIPLQIGRHQPLGCPLRSCPRCGEKIPQLITMGAANNPHGPLRVPDQPAKGERWALVRVRTVARFMGPAGPQLFGRLPTGGRLLRGTLL